MKNRTENTDTSRMVQRSLKTVMSKLEVMIEKRYQAKFEVLNPLRLKLQLGEKQVKKISLCQNVFNLESESYFPIFIENDFICAAKISHKKKISKRDIEYIRDLIDLLLTSSLSVTNRLLFLDVLEAQVLQAEGKGPEKDSSNILYIDDFRQTQQVSESHLKIYERHTSRFHVPCLIESKEALDSLKMAVEIHEQSGRYAFVHFDQLSHGARTNPKNLKDFGNMTLYIKEIMNLSPKEVNCLEAFLNDLRGKDSPQIINGSSMPLGDIIKSKKFSDNFIHTVSTAYLKMARPFSEYRSEGVVSFFYESLVNRPPLS